MMNGVAILKLEERLWEDIKQGKKYTEIRKLNKDYIQVGYDIVYIGLYSGKVLGEVRVIGKSYQKPLDMATQENHNPTIDFIYDNYLEESYLIRFTIVYDKEF